MVGWAENLRILPWHPQSHLEIFADLFWHRKIRSDDYSPNACNGLNRPNSRTGPQSRSPSWAAGTQRLESLGCLPESAWARGWGQETNPGHSGEGCEGVNWEPNHKEKYSFHNPNFWPNIILQLITTTMDPQTLTSGLYIMRHKLRTPFLLFFIWSVNQYFKKNYNILETLVNTKFLASLAMSWSRMENRLNK